MSKRLLLKSFAKGLIYGLTYGVFCAIGITAVRRVAKYVDKL